MNTDEIREKLEKGKPLPRIQQMQEEGEVGIEEIAPRIGRMIESGEELTIADLFPRASELVSGRGWER